MESAAGVVDVGMVVAAAGDAFQGSSPEPRAAGWELAAVGARGSSPAPQLGVAGAERVPGRDGTTGNKGGRGLSVGALDDSGVVIAR